MQLRNSALAALAFVSMAFQCGHDKWARYAREYKIEVSPRTIVLADDTLRCRLLIEGPAKGPDRDANQTFELFTKGASESQKVAEFILPDSGMVDLEIVHVVTLEKPIQSLDVRLTQYKKGKVTLMSPELTLAAIHDMR